MFGLTDLVFSAALLQLSFVSLFVSTFVTLCVALYCWAFKTTNTTTASYYYMVVNYCLTIILIGHGALFVGNFYFYLRSFESLALLVGSEAASAFKNFSSCSVAGTKLSIDLYGFVLLLLAFFVGFFALLSSESKIKNLIRSPISINKHSNMLAAQGLQILNLQIKNWKSVGHGYIHHCREPNLINIVNFCYWILGLKPSGLTG